MISIADNKVVTLSYVLKSSTGEVLDESSAADPFVYLHGHGQIVPGLEDALAGKASGYKGKVEVTPAEGYGEEINELKISVGRGQFPPDMNPEPGMRVRAQAGDQPVTFVIEKIEGDTVHLNGNHPLAGQTLYFDVEVTDVRDASLDEISHGHAHGAGGHQH